MSRERRKRSPPFVMVYHTWMRSPAWLALSGSEVKVLMALLQLYNGDNNGKLFMGNRTGAAMTGLSRGTVWAALKGLEERGFIRTVTPGGFDQKRLSTTYRLTVWPCNGRAATHDYLKHNA